MIQDPAGRKGTVEPQLEARGDSTYRCSYQPTMEGVHTVHVTFAGVPIPRSPYTVTVGQGRPVPAAPRWARLQPCGLGGGQPGRSRSSPRPGSLGFCTSAVRAHSFWPGWDPSPPPPLALSISLSPRFHLRKSSLQLSRNLLLSALPTGSTVLGSVFLGAGGRRAGGWRGWSRWEEACHGQFFLTRPSPALWEQGRGRPRQLPAAQPALCPQLVTQVPAAPSAEASNPRVCE